MGSDKVSGNTESLKAEYNRLDEARANAVPWSMWGPYLSERQWGTVREDYSPNGDAWDYFTHDQARSRAYRWGEDGIAGISDDRQILCFSLALWNGADPILKERLFGLTNSEGNHGEDVKEYYFYLDSTPTHSYMKMLYKYPQSAYPYDDLVATNKKRSREEPEYELLDTGVFNQNRYFDVFVEYAKVAADDLLISITAFNRGDQDAALHLLPTLWFRNTWWEDTKPSTRPALSVCKDGAGVHGEHAQMGTYELRCEGQPSFLFTDNETNEERNGGKSVSAYTKDAFHRYLLHGEKGAVNPTRTGTKAAAHCDLKVPAGKSVTVRMRLAKVQDGRQAGFEDFASVMDLRRKEADDFYHLVLPEHVSDDEKLVMRQAFAGMLWSKQFYHYDLERWLEHRDVTPNKNQSAGVRNSGWFHMLTQDVISMPDKWEYPWFAAWDLAFHTLPLAMVDLAFAKNQLKLMLNNLYLHPNGQLPAYEWNFGDVNPPVHAWAVLSLYRAERAQRGESDIAFLEQCFQKLLLNFTWWLNRKDATGKNVFQGGFLGLDNIGVFDRSSPLPTGGHLEQADGTAWMCLFSQNMLQIAIELSATNPMYSEMALKFTEHFLWIASAMDGVGENDDQMWDEQDGFFYDILRFPDGRATRLKLRSMVGLLPLCATTVIESQYLADYPETVKRVDAFLERHPELCDNITSLRIQGVNGRRILTVLNEGKLRRVLHRMLDPNEFLSDYGIRSISKSYEANPFVFEYADGKSSVEYLPGESNTGMFGGNSNWRGPIWMPVNTLILRALYQFYQFYGDDFKIECPTGSGKMMTLYEVAVEINQRLANIFLRDGKGRRAVYGSMDKFQNDPYWKDLILFHEYFHGEDGAGLGASHQTGWTGVIAYLMRIAALVNPETVLRTESAYAAIQVEPHKPTST
jgi:Mannosylglycerate hydrolase MGH1-like glycoside hydrolase domain